MLCLLTRDSRERPCQAMDHTYILFTLLGVATSVFPLVVFDFVSSNTCGLNLALILLNSWHYLWSLSVCITRTVESKVGKEKFHKSQHWGFCNNVRMLVSDEKRGIGGEMLPGQKIKPKNTVFPKGDGADAPAWVAFDKQVLCFDAYLEDEVPDKRQENYRIRYYKIYFYLEDDTIQVNEPEVINSRLPQGCYVHRNLQEGLKLLAPVPETQVNPLFEVGKEKFHKSQHWGFCNNVRMLVSDEKRGIGGEMLPGQKIKPKNTVFPKGDGADAPAWVAFDKQVLCFDAYLEDEVPDKRQENYRIRYYKIYFYLEDDTIQVNEPEVINSGLPQGTSIRRHRITLPPPDDDQFYTVYHFNINTDVVFYGRTFKIYDCDSFTKNFLRKIGIKLNPPLPRPVDPYMKMRRETLEFVDPFRPYQYSDTLKRFLLFDGKVLRFFCLWDDTSSLFGDRREFVLHYFLCDDTIEIRELLPLNSGRDAMSSFLRRGKLPKYGPPGIFQPGQITDRAVLNVYGGLSEWRANDYLLDKYQLGKIEQDFYTDRDLTIGATINVWGRKVLLCDCDEFTKTYYRTKYGIDNFTAISCKPPPLPKIERKYPPYTGFGSEEDSFRSCVGLKPTPHRRNFKKFMELDSYGNESNILRYFAKLITEKCADLDRMFVIAFYLSDDTISVFEPIERNSGNAGGMFLKRSRVKKPGQEVFKSEFSEYIKAEELYIGTTVNVNGYLFFLLNADEYTLRYMENNTDKFPYSNFELAIQKLKQEKSKSREIMQVFSAADHNHTKVLPYNTFREILMNITMGKLIEQEFITIARHYRVPEFMDPDITYLIAKAHEKFKKNMYENFDVFIYNCVYEDRQKKGVLPTKDIKRMCKSSRLPLSDDLLDSLLYRFEDKEQQINYEIFFSILNWRMNPTPEMQSPSYLKEKCEDIWTGMPSPIPVKFVRYLDFLDDVYGLQEN